MARSTIAICAARAARSVRVGVGAFHPAQPVPRVAAELAELIRYRPGVTDHDHAQRLQGGLARAVRIMRSRSTGIRSGSVPNSAASFDGK